METLYDRLRAIAIQQGHPKGRSADICSVTGLSRGRVSQIKSAGNTTDLDSKTLERLANIGYSPAWVRNGTSPMRIGLINTPKAIAELKQESAASAVPSIPSERDRLLLEMCSIAHTMSLMELMELKVRASDIVQRRPLQANTTSSA